MPEDANNFYESERVSARTVEFSNLFQMTMAGNLFVPADLDRNAVHPAIVVGHPMGAVKEQSANLYATQLAERGFVTLAIDLPCWGDSEGPRNRVSPDLYAEGFSAGVDFLASQAFVNADAIGGIGICGSGGFILSAAKIDSRLKAIATVSMYDMGQASRHGIGNSVSLDDRKAMIDTASAQRNVEFAGGETEYTGGAPHTIDANSDPVAREFYDFYRTPRGEFTPKGQSSARTTHPTLTSNVKFLNFYPFNDLDTIAPRPLLFVSGDQAHSREFSEDAYARAAEPKELYWVPGAGHVDLYDRLSLIPFDKLERFFSDALA
ncbi:alpha/beta hydrolase [Salinisphaera sp. SPP-AMP-43]|uniref:alpha/beta hydrolase n=1 Tax=Salinisphaera sp. SPP-AMP-43 TaxID=3121288 RepID=UPI003C6E9BE3